MQSLARLGANSRLAAGLRHLNLTATGLGAVVLAFGCWLAAHQVGSTTTYLMAYAAIAAVGMAYLLARRRLSMTALRSNLPTRVLSGQTVDVELVVTSTRRLSTILIEETLPDGFGQSVTIPVASLPAGQDLTYRYSFVPPLRGVYSVGPLTATWSDPYGFTTHRQVILPAQDIIVHPRAERVHDRVLTRMWEDPPVRPPTSKPWPVGFEFYGLRDYVPGDDLRRVVWSAVAKTGRMLVRESEQGITDRICIYLDDSRENHSPGSPSLTFETAVRVAASVGQRHLHDGFAVSLLTNGGRVSTSLRGRSAQLTLMDDLARLQPREGSIDDVGHLLLDEVRSGSHVVVIAADLDDRAAARLRLAVERGGSVVIALVLWDEMSPLAAARAAAIGASVVQVPAHAPLEAAFAHLAGKRR